MNSALPDSHAMRAEADRLGRQAALLEKFARERYADSAMRYRGGSSTFVRSIDTADGYAKEAAALRDREAQFRRAADYIYETEEKDQ